jgi:thiol-disulfide isomerase/thioredoxin
MKKLVTLFLALAIGFGLKAQCPLTQAIDFTATDCHGTEIHLFDILDGGQYVLIDFFFANCGPCQQATPKVVESYYAMGCNMHDVFYMEISDRDSDAVCQNWCQNYGVEYPTISGAAGGSTICGTSMYHIPAYPTVILIAPDRSILINDLWPINNAQTVITALEQHGIQQHDCNAVTYDPQVTITVDQVLETEVTATFTPNEDCVSYAYTMATEAEIQEWMTLTGLELPEYLWTYGIPGSGTLSHNFTDLTPDTEYIIFAVPADIDGNLGEVVQEPVTTTPGGSTEIMPDFTTTDIEGNEIHLYDILDAGQAVLINFFLTGDPYSEQPMPDMIEAYRLYGCNEHDVFFMEISPNGHDEQCQEWVSQFGVQYPTISRDGGGNDIAQAIPVGYYPTIMLIRPDHTFANRDIYPPTLEYIINAMNAEGYEQHECPYEETLTFNMNTVNLDWCEMAYITIYNNTAVDATITNICDERYELGFYIGPDSQEWPSCNVSEFTIPQGGSVELGIICCVTGRSIVPDVVTVTSNLPETQFVVMVDDTWSVDENEVSATLFPNPANDFVTLSGETLGTVRVYNTLGQKVGEFVANGSELRINTTGYENGVYFVKTDEKTMKLVVKH